MIRGQQNATFWSVSGGRTHDCAVKYVTAIIELNLSEILPDYLADRQYLSVAANAV